MGVLGRVNTSLAMLAADAVLTRPVRAQWSALMERRSIWVLSTFSRDQRFSRCSPGCPGVCRSA